MEWKEGRKDRLKMSLIEASIDCLLQREREIGFVE
jgi:hypothetical protein